MTKGIDKILVATLATILLVIALGISNKAFANDAELDFEVDRYEARSIARHYLNSIGYTRPGTSIKTARVGTARLEDGVWIVAVKIGRQSPNQHGVVLIDAVAGSVLNEDN